MMPATVHIPVIKGEMARVLVLGGGGVKGIRQINWLKKIDLAYSTIVGTSVGALIGATLILNEQKLFEFPDYCKEIFKNRRLVPPHYDIKRAEAVLDEAFSSAKVGDLKCRLLYTACNITTLQEVIVDSDRQRQMDPDRHLASWLLPTMAAPTYFSPVSTPYGLCMDGGAGQNNIPALAAYGIVMNGRVALDVVGTGYTSPPRAKRRSLSAYLSLADGGFARVASRDTQLTILNGLTTAKGDSLLYFDYPEVGRDDDWKLDDVTKLASKQYVTLQVIKPQII